MTVLVTGYPALRARQVVDCVAAAEPDGEIVALVANERLAEAAEAAAALEPSVRRRVELIQGDAAAIDFGLPGHVYLELARRVDVLHGVYSIVGADVDGALAEHVNIGAARELVELARAAEPACGIVFYSSVFVSGNRSGVVREEELEARQSFRNAAERSLAVAERMLRQSGLPVAVLRAGHLLGDRRSGAIEVLTAPYSLLALVATGPEELPLPLPPGSDARLPVTPVDYLAAFGAHIARERRFGRTLHVLAPEQPTIRRFLELAAEHSGRRVDPGLTPGVLTRALLGTKAARLFPQNARAVQEVQGAAAEYATEGADELVAEGAPRCPPLSVYLDVLFAHIRERIENGTLSSTRRDSAPFLVA